MMKLYAIPRKDGGVSLMECKDGINPENEIAKWAPVLRAAVTGEVHEIDRAGLPKDKKHRNAWRFRNGTIEIDAAKKAALDARPAPLTLEQRVAALERLQATG